MSKVKTEQNPDTSSATDYVAAGEVTAPAVVKKELKFSVKKNVTLPLFKWENGVAKFVTIKGEIFQGKPIAETGSAAKKEPAFLCEVVDLETGELGQIIVATVLHKNLDEEYPDGAYVGLSFRLLQRRLPGKNYNSFDIAEIEVE